MKRVLFLLMAFMMLVPSFAIAETPSQANSPTDILIDDEYSDDTAYRMFDEQGNYMTSRGGRIYEGDELITSDNQLYRIVSVDDVQHTAIAQHVGDEPAISRSDVQPAMAVLSATAAPSATNGGSENPSNNKLICMYSTHSDESYVPSDGTSSKTTNAGIYDVGDELKKNLESLGIEVEYSKETSLPHDAGAYRRSRQIAEDFIKQRPAALLDIHRDGIPDPSEYATTVDGEKMTKVRLFVGRNNPNADTNRAMAKKLKAEADKKYPNLIKDIFIGKGNYNQELYPQALLLEFGTHTSDKELVKKSTSYMAEVINDVLFSGTAKAEDEATGTPSNNRTGGAGIAWLIGIAIVGAAIYGLVATGTLKNWQGKLARGTSELTGGLIGKDPDDDDKDK